MRLWIIGLALACNGSKDAVDTVDTPVDGDADTDADADSDADTDTTTTTSTTTTTTTTTTVTTVPVCQDILVAPPIGPITTPTTIGPATGVTGDTGQVAAGGVLFYDAQFGVNVTGCLDEVNVDGTIVYPAINFHLGDPAWVNTGFDFGRTDLYCTVSLLLGGGIENPLWVTNNPDLWYGVEHDGVSAITNCGSDTPLGADPVGALLSYPDPYGVGVGSRVSPLVAQTLQSSGANPADFLGTLLLTPFLPVVGDEVFTAVFEVDAAQSAVINGGLFNQLDPTTLLQPNGTIKEGYYNVFAIYYFNF